MTHDTYRFLVPILVAGSAVGEEVSLPDEEAHHARNVLRLDAGAAVTIFNGLGISAGVEICAIGKRGVSVRITSVPARDAESRRGRLQLATAIPKGDRAEWLVEQASQLNVASLLWLDCDRSVVKVRDREHRLEKWMRLARESAKQCGRNTVMAVTGPMTLETLLGTLNAAESPRMVWLDSRHDARPAGDALGTGPVIALVGPEGGWSDRERELLEAGARAGRIVPIRLGLNVLRIETACAAIASIVLGGVGE